MSVYTGFCRLQIVDDLGLGTSHRTYSLSSGDTTAADKIFKVAPGQSLAFTFKNVTDGLAPPGDANNLFQILLYKETGTGTLIRAIVNTLTPPADGTVYTVYGTADGLVGGATRGFTGRLYIRAKRSGGAAGLGDYDRDSDNNFGTGNAASAFDPGVFQSGLAVSAINANTYPAAATFAYGTAANETITLTATHTLPIAVQSHEQLRIDALEVAAVQASGTAQTANSAGSTAQSFTANNTFDDASKSYGARLVVVGNALLVPTSGAIPWTFIDVTMLDASGNGNIGAVRGVPTISGAGILECDGVGSNDNSQGVVQSGTLTGTTSWKLECKVRRDRVNVAEVPFAWFDPNWTGGEVAGQGKSGVYGFFLSDGTFRVDFFNDATGHSSAATALPVGTYTLSAELSGTSYLVKKDGVTVASGTIPFAFPTVALKVTAGRIIFGASDAAAPYAADVGIDYVDLIRNSVQVVRWDMTALTASNERQSFYTVDPRITMPVVTPGQTIYNRGEPATLDITLKNARNESLTRSVPFQLKDSTGAVKASPTDTGAVYDVDYTILSTDDAIADATGKQWTVNSNITDVDSDPSANAYKVSSLYFADVHTQKGATLIPDPFPFDEDGEDHGFVILGDVVRGWGILANIRGELIDTTSGNRVTVTVRDPDSTLIQTLLMDTKPDATNGSRSGYTPRFAVNPTAPAGNWSFTMDVAHNGNTVQDVETNVYITPLTSNLETLALGPGLIRPGSAFRLHFQSQTNDASSVPETLPIYRIYKVAANGKTLEAISAEAGMLNAVNDTATINGGDYYVDLTAPTTAGRYGIYTRAQIQGNGVRRFQVFRVAKDKFDPAGLFAGPT